MEFIKRVSAAYKALGKTIGVSRPAFYGKLNGMGQTETGRLFEQKVQVEEDGVILNLRRVVIRLHQPTRHGDTEVALLTHLSPSVADAPTVARLYLQRWSIEGMFQVITDTFNCELNTLGYPKAALFVFCLAIVAFYILSTVKAALKSVHGVGKIEAGLSDYYLVEEIQGTFRGLAIALPTLLWSSFVQMNASEIAHTLKKWATQVYLKRCFFFSQRSEKAKA